MSNDYFNHVDFRVEDGITARGADVNNPLDQVVQGFEKLPAEQNIKRGLINYAVTTGSGNTYAVASPYPATAYTDGMEVVFKANHANTGGATLNVDGLGARSVLRSNGDPISASEIPSGKLITVRYNATSAAFEIQSSSPGMTAEAVAARDAAQASETAAAASQSAAASSASAAAGSASAASTSATNAANSATSAGNSATSATNSASSASTSASNAASSASGASTSATNAANSASAASTSASNAATSATNASNSATASASSASNAASSASAAATSESNAATSATNAAGSAVVAEQWAASIEAQYEPTVLPTISSDFERNKHELYEQYGNEPKTILQTWTTTRATTGTYHDAAGVIRTAGIDEPRIDYDPVTGRASLLVEEARTNLLTYSEQFDNAAWAKTNATVTANTIVAPDGALTGDKVIADATNNFHSLQYNFGAATAGDVYTGTVYLKAGEYTTVSLRVGRSNSSEGIDVDLTDGSITREGGNVQSSSATNVGNGWYRVRITVGILQTHSSQYLAIGPNLGDTVSFVGDGTSGIYIWGAQVEAASTPSSYIPTVASSVTRSADTVSRVLGDEFTADGFTVFGEFIFKRLDTTNRAMSIGTGSENRIELVNPELVTRIAGGAIRVISISPAMDAGTKYNLAYSVTRTAVTLSINGALIGSVAVDDALLTATRLWLSGNASGAGEPTISYSSAKYIPIALSDAELQEMTKL